MKFHDLPKVLVYSDGDLAWIPVPDCPILSFLLEVPGMMDDRESDRRCSPSATVHYWDSKNKILMLLMCNPAEAFLESGFECVATLFGKKIRRWTFAAGD